MNTFTGSRGPTALAQVYLHSAHFYIDGSHRTVWREAGFWISSGDVTVLDEGVSDDVLGAAIIAALDASRVEVPVPPREARLDAPLLTAMGLRSRSLLVTTTRTCIVTREAPDNVLKVEPQRDGSRKGEPSSHVGVPSEAITLHEGATASEIAQAVRRAMSL
jgi:hypothetical protein